MTFQLHPYQRMLVYLWAITPRCQRNLHKSRLVPWPALSIQFNSPRPQLQNFWDCIFYCYFTTTSSITTSATSSLQELHLLLHRFRNYICYFIASGTTSIDTTSGITSATSLLNMATEQEYDDIYRYKTSTQKYRPGLSDNEKRNIRDKASR